MADGLIAIAIEQGRLAAAYRFIARKDSDCESGMTKRATKASADSAEALNTMCRSLGVASAQAGHAPVAQPRLSAGPRGFE